LALNPISDLDCILERLGHGPELLLQILLPVGQLADSLLLLRDMLHGLQKVSRLKGYLGLVLLTQFERARGVLQRREELRVLGLQEDHLRVQVANRELQVQLLVKLGFVFQFQF
jgi:hypothetical protein